MLTRDEGMICSRCNKPTGNNNQGHYWAYCKVVRAIVTYHFCCPDDCELDSEQQATRQQA